MKSPVPSPTALNWRRFRQHPSGMLAGLWIALWLVLALGAKVFSEDASPDAKRQLAELKLRPPGFAVQALKVRRNVPEPPTRLADWWRGRENAHTWVPLKSLSYEGQVLRVLTYGGRAADGGIVDGRELRFHMADVLLPLAAPIALGDTSGHYVLVDGRSLALDAGALRQGIEAGHIERLHFLLGTDYLGRSMWSRLLLGARVSLSAGLIAVGISLSLGIVLGIVAGYFGGRSDTLVLLLINAVWSVPTLLLVLAIVLAFGRSAGIIYAAIGLTMWVDVARVVRGQVMALKGQPFVEAARAFGFSHGRIVWRYVLPNIMAPVLVLAASNFAMAILLESGLSFLGFGVQPPTPSWGNMLNENYGYAVSGKAFLMLVPALAIMLLVLAFNVLGNALRDVLDVRLRPGA